VAAAARFRAAWRRRGRRRSVHYKLIFLPDIKTIKKFLKKKRKKIGGKKADAWTQRKVLGGRE
jgi:uncharacterized protein (DUF1810 family)